jgi:hypothetical protein
VVKQEIDFEIFASDFEWHLAADESKADTKLDQELAQVSEESSFEVAFLCLLSESEKSKL